MLSANSSMEFSHGIVFFKEKSTVEKSCHFLFPAFPSFSTKEKILANKWQIYCRQQGACQLIVQHSPQNCKANDAKSGGGRFVCAHFRQICKKTSGAHTNSSRTYTYTYISSSSLSHNTYITYLNIYIYLSWGIYACVFSIKCI